MHFQSLRKDNSDENFRLFKWIWDNIPKHATKRVSKRARFVLPHLSICTRPYSKTSGWVAIPLYVFLTQAKHSTLSGDKGLMYQLRSLRIRGKLWQIIDSVIVNLTKSRWFNVEQGVTQGGVLSTFLNLVFINDLLIDLENCNFTSSGCILDSKYHCPGRWNFMYCNIPESYASDDEYHLHVLL